MNYPNNIKKQYKRIIESANRGMTLENDLNITNEYYKDQGIALVYKKPTPIKVVDLSYNKNKVTINKAFFEKASTTDYNGIYKGKYIDFEAKEVNSTTSFCLANIQKHQIEHLFKVLEHGGISFLIVRFIRLDKTFFISSQVLKEFVNTYERKSIPISFFEENGYVINTGYSIRVDYISILNNLYFGGFNESN